jgi:hypothetical protein
VKAQIVGMSPDSGPPDVPGGLNTVNVSVNSHELVSFDGMESNIWLNATSYFASGGGVTTTYARYTWEFGDVHRCPAGRATRRALLRGAFCALLTGLRAKHEVP